MGKINYSYGIITVLSFVCVFFDSALDEGALLHRRNLLSETATTIMKASKHRNSLRNYTQNDIEETAANLEGSMPPRLLVWSQDDGFRVYNLENSLEQYKGEYQGCPRGLKIIPLLIHALKTNHPDRFQPGQPDFQFLWSDGDVVQTPCVNDHLGCQTELFAPIAFFGSVPRDPVVLPTVTAMPNWFYINCLYNWKMNFHEDTNCWFEGINADTPFDNLTKTVFWRGSDFSFLNFYAAYENKFRPIQVAALISGNEDATATINRIQQSYDKLLPRWQGVTLSLLAELRNETWIDVKFNDIKRAGIHDRFNARGVNVSSEEYFDSYDMSKYKYQIDFGGGGGTSWRGTLSKLAMPGLLMHHETLTKDWFYDEMKPHLHYLPIKTDLSNLKEQYLWAEEHPAHTKQIAENGIKLAEYLFSEEYMTKVYQELFVDYLGSLVKHYQPTAANWTESRQQYLDSGFKLVQVAYCQSSECLVNTRGDTYKSFPHVRLAQPSVVSQEYLEKDKDVTRIE